jgi:imidazoleglycerol-phosphate dehydratase
LDGTGRADISTGIPFFDHMLEQLARHGMMDISIKAKGDVEVDFHHTVEDVGICTGQAIRKALGDSKGIRRFGHAQVPMDDSLVSVSMDISGRPYLVYRVANQAGWVGAFPVNLIQEFYRAVSQHAGITLHIHALEGQEPHHTTEATFKAFSRALAEAVSSDERVQGVPSTKGSLD